MSEGVFKAHWHNDEDVMIADFPAATNVELVRCADCVNWNTMVPDGLDNYEDDRWCPVVRKCTRPGEWCCWGAKGEQEEVTDER